MTARRRQVEPQERCEACGAMVSKSTTSVRFVGRHAPLYAVVCESCDQLNDERLRARWDYWQTFEEHAGSPDMGGEA